MRAVLKFRTLLLVLAFAMIAAACASDDEGATSTDEAADPTEEVAADEAMTDEATTDTAPTEDAAATGTESAAADSSTTCDAEAIVAAVEGGSEEGTLAGMTDDPVGTAASNNPVLTTLTAAATEAGLVDTLNSAEALTVFAPTDCAFAGLDPATMEAAMADPQGLLAQVLGFHVIPGEQIASAELSGEYETVNGQTLTVSGTDVNGQATIVVPDIQTANATVHLIDTVLMPTA